MNRRKPYDPSQPLTDLVTLRSPFFQLRGEPASIFETQKVPNLFLGTPFTGSDPSR